MPLPKKHAALAVLSKARLLEIGSKFGVPVKRNSSKADVLDKLTRSRKAPLSKIVSLELSVSELREICISHHLAACADRRELLVCAILGYCHPQKASGETGNGLRPFFGYYGGKWRDAPKHYPAPIYDTIIEPFAGSAGYSLRYPSRKVVLVEIDPVVASIWEYLISVDASEILRLPNIGPGQTIDDLKVPQEAKWLVGFWLNRGVAAPRKQPSKWMREGMRPGSFWGDQVKRRIASQVEHIRHWKICSGTYDSAPCLGRATWFVDPPYQKAGHHYRFGSQKIDYPSLGAWCAARPGQVIVCENEGADWLPFELLSDIKTTRRNQRCREVCWALEGDESEGHAGVAKNFMADEALRKAG